MVERKEPRRGELWWAVSDKRRPVVVVQADFLNRGRTDWVLAVPVTTHLTRVDVPGNVRLAPRDTALRRASVANVGQVAPVHRTALGEKIARLPDGLLHRIDEGLRLVLSLGDAR